MSQKRKRSLEQRGGGSEAAGAINVFRSESIKDRASTFIGYFSPSLKPSELQKLEEIASADHKILGWRRESNQQSITGAVRYTVDHDDDGEQYAGKTIEKALENMQVSGACVVARWYGGVLLGPVRFTYIESCAREAIKKYQEAEVERIARERQEEEDAKDFERLVKVLPERDESIQTLRNLAAEKETRIKVARATTHTAFANSSADYGTMDADKLRALEKARDATLSFFLKRIYKAEAELAKVEKGL